MEVVGASAPPPAAMAANGDSNHQQQAATAAAERLNAAVQQQLNLESVKTRALGLYNAISRILEHIDLHSRSNSLPKWQETLGQFSMVNMELYNIVEDIKKVSKPFVVHPKNVNGDNASILPVMLSSKLLPEMEAEDNTKREQLLSGISNLPVTTQIEKLKVMICMFIHIDLYSVKIALIITIIRAFSIKMGLATKNRFVKDLTEFHDSLST